MIVLVAMPMVASTIAVVALAFMTRRLEGEFARLRGSLRRAGAAAVAADELGRATSIVGRRAVESVRQARAATGRPRTGASRPPR